MATQLRKFNGYSLPMALFRNKDSVKYLATIIMGYQTYVISTIGFDWKGFVLTLGLGLATLIGKLFADAIDYYFTEVTI